MNKYVDRTLKFIKLIITEQLNQLHQEEWSVTVTLSKDVISTLICYSNKYLLTEEFQVFLFA